MRYEPTREAKVSARIARAYSDLTAFRAAALASELVRIANARWHAQLAEWVGGQSLDGEANGYTLPNVTLDGDPRGAVMRARFPGETVYDGDDGEAI